MWCFIMANARKPNKLVGYHSKRLPDAVSRYSINELELTGLASNISGFKHVLSKTEFTVYVDHSALCHILKAKRQAPTLRLRKLIEILSDYSFVVKYHKGSEMHIADIPITLWPVICSYTLQIKIHL